jgi:hypothetical protein
VVRVGLGHNIEDAVKTGFTQPPNPMRTTSNNRAPNTAWPQVFDVALSRKAERIDTQRSFSEYV